MEFMLGNKIYKKQQVIKSDETKKALLTKLYKTFASLLLTQTKLINIFATQRVHLKYTYFDDID